MTPTPVKFGKEDSVFLEYGNSLREQNGRPEAGTPVRVCWASSGVVRLDLQLRARRVAGRIGHNQDGTSNSLDYRGDSVRTTFDGCANRVAAEFDLCAWRI